MNSPLNATPAASRAPARVSSNRGPLGLLGWSALGVAGLIVAPILAVVASVFVPGESTWAHLASTVLPAYVWNTVLLLAGVSWGVISIGVLSAWLVTAYRFPGSRILEWALILPLAMPAYVMAYAYTDWLQFTGPVQTGLRALTGWEARDYWFPDVRSVPGAAAMFSFAFYPYVYLLARNAFLTQSRSAVEAARLAGHGAWGSFFRAALPLARPAIAGGTALALMESLADFGVVSYFAVETFTTGIFKAWLSMGDLAAAAQLASALMGFVLVVLLLERWTRGAARYHNTSLRAAMPPQRLRGAGAAVALVACAAPVALGFLLPAAILLAVALDAGAEAWTPRVGTLMGNSVSVSAVTACAAVAIAVVLAYAGRVCRRPVVSTAGRVAALGYAVPGAVIAIGIMVPLGRLDNALAGWLGSAFGIELGLLFIGTTAALVYAYLVRFLAVALHTVEAGLAEVRPSMDDAARGLGLGVAATLRRIHVPLLLPSLLSAGLLVFVDTMKELPATFALRPFNFDTLAVAAYHLTKDERLAEAAMPSLLIVAVGLVPLVLISRRIMATRR
jgi:iron(III) transport system permease protein